MRSAARSPPVWRRLTPAAFSSRHQAGERLVEGPEKPIRQPIAPQDKQLSESALRAVAPGPLAVDGGRKGKVKILDFGLAKSWADDSAISDRGML